MKVLLVNGSPNEKRCTYTALSEVAGALEAQGVDAEIAWIGRDPVRGCLGARRAGTTPAIDQINKYFQINCMPVVSSNYWPMVHGRSVEDVRQDAEGLQIMRVLGTNMAWMLQATSAAPAPNVEQKIMTSFIR